MLGPIARVLASAKISRRGEQRVVVACSGGLDSVVLAHALVELLGARRVILAHVDHAIRGDSAADTAFVENYARALGSEFRSARLEAGPADEARLRRLRYAELEKIRKNTGASRVLTAHTQDDQAETVLLALVRSARVKSLRGIEIARRRVLRPMLETSRAEVAAYAAKHRLAHRDDPSNLEPRYLRNRIRKELLPLLERRYRANMTKRLARLASSIARELPLEKRAEPLSLRKETQSLSVCAISMERRTWERESIPDGKVVAIFDADVLQRPVVRVAAKGDRIQIFGMEGRRKVRDLLREAQVPVEARGSYPIVTDAKGDVLWVPGAARSNAYPVGPSTRNVWVFWMNDSDKLQGAVERVTVEEQDQDE